MPAVKSLATPVIWILLLLGLVLTRSGGRKRFFRAGRALLLLGSALLAALSLRPVTNMLTYPLESRYRPLAPGGWANSIQSSFWRGGSRPSRCLPHKTDLGTYAYPRSCQGVRIFRNSRAGLLAFCGGPHEDGGESEAEANIVKETRSHTTFENTGDLTHPRRPGRAAASDW